jgi:hypothetical protein
VILAAASTTSRSGRAARRLNTVAPATASRNAATPIQISASLQLVDQLLRRRPVDEQDQRRTAGAAGRVERIVAARVARVPESSIARRRAARDVDRHRAARAVGQAAAPQLSAADDVHVGRG